MRFVAALDPDSTQTAIAWAQLGQCSLAGDRAWQFLGAEGGGASKIPVGWSTITGAQAWLLTARAKHGVGFGEMTIVIETQAPNGAHSSDVESLRRVRYHWEAACELLGVCCVFVDACTWERAFAGECKARGKGALKKACQVRAKKLAPSLANGDQRDAFGMLSWYVGEQFGESLHVGE